MNFNIFIHRNTTEIKTAMMKITGSINVNTPTLTQPTPTNHKCYSPYNIQSGCMNFNATATSYNWVTQILKLCMETTSPYEGHTSCPSFLRLLHPTSGILRYTSGLRKILHRLRLTLLTMIVLWGAPYKQPRQGDVPRSTPTYYPGGCVYVCCQFTTPRWGVTHFYQRLRLCSCSTKPQHSKNYHSMMTSS